MRLQGSGLCAWVGIEKMETIRGCRDALATVVAEVWSLGSPLIPNLPACPVALYHPLFAWLLLSQPSAQNGL